MYLGIDCGTQGTKALVLDSARGRVLGEGAAPHALLSGPNGRREQEVSQWTEALVAAVRQAVTQAGVDGQAIRGLGVSGQQHGLVLLDAQGRVLRPAKLWCDTESTAENDALLAWLGGTRGSLERLGVAIAPGYTVSKLLWTRTHCPELFSRTAHILLPHDYLNCWLTGEYATEYGDASGTGYFNVRTRQWDLDLLRHIDPSGRLTRALPRLVESDTPVGTLKADVARLLGLTPGIPVASGGGDNMMGAIGTGNIEPGAITMSLGTSGTLYAYSPEPTVIAHPAVATFCSSSGGWLPLICTMNLTNANAAVRELLEIDLDTFSAFVAQAPIGSDGVTMLPFLNGERVPPLPHASASLHGLTMDNFSRANLCRAVLEGVTFGLRYGLDLLREAGITSARIRLVGGGARNPVWRQLIADVMNTPVICTQHAEAGALGAALQAAWCDARRQGQTPTLAELCARCVALASETEAQPQPDAVEQYEAAYRRYRGLIGTLYR